MTNRSLTLGIDQGTSSTRAALFDDHGNLIAISRRDVTLDRIDRERIEQDPLELLESVRDCIREVCKSNAAPETINVAGLATQRSSVLAWDRQTCAPLSRVLSWQDTRTREQLLSEHQEFADQIRQRSGLVLSPHCGGSKIAWLMKQSEVVSLLTTGRVVIGPLAAFLIHCLTAANEPRVDHANAGRTQLMNLDAGDWDEWLLERFGVQRDVLPAVVPNRFEFGALQELPQTRLTVAQGDQTAAIFGCGPLAAGEIHINLGTGGFVLAKQPSAYRRIAGMLTSIAHSAAAEGKGPTEESGPVIPSRTYVVEGTVNGAAAAIDWAAEARGVSDVDPKFDAWVADHDSIVSPQHPVFFVNSVGGLGSPWWTIGPPAGWRIGYQSNGPGDSTSRLSDAQAFVAVAESIAFLVRANVEAMKAGGLDIQSVRLTGGLSQSSPLAQMLADVLQLPIRRPSIQEATVRGAAWLAADRPPAWLGADVDDEWANGTRWQPRAQDASLEQRYLGFQKWIRGRD